VGAVPKPKKNLKRLGSLHQTRGNRIITESVLLSSISDKKDPNLKKKCIFFIEASPHKVMALEI